MKENYRSITASLPHQSIKKTIKFYTLLKIYEAEHSESLELYLVRSFIDIIIIITVSY